MHHYFLMLSHFGVAILGVRYSRTPVLEICGSFPASSLAIQAD